MNNYPKDSIDLRKATYLRPPAKLLSSSRKLKMTTRWTFHMLRSGQKQGRGWGCCHSPGREVHPVPFVTSETADFQKQAF